MTSPASTQRVLILNDSTDTASSGVAENTARALAEARVEADIVDLSDDLSAWHPAGHSAILTATANLDRLTPAQAALIEESVAQGAGLAALCAARPNVLDAVFGVRFGQHIPFTGASEGGGIRFPGRALPLFEGLSLTPEEMIGHAHFGQWAAPGCQLLATSYGGKPVAWARRHGAGRVAYWNTGLLGERHARGLIVQTLEAVQEVSAVPCVNAGVMQIDDFPAPLHKPLPEAVRMGLPEGPPEAFYADIWYKDVSRLARRYGVALSCFCALRYSAWEGAAEDGTHPEPEGSLRRMFEALRRNPPAELGLHGLNHVPLTAGHWPDAREMRAALRQAAALWEALGCGPPPSAYVPPNNQIDAVGLAALTEVFPQIEVICSSIFGATEAGAAREAGPEPWDPSRTALPRATSGHEAANLALFDGASQLACLGLWAHFIHPDDIDDIPPPGTAATDRRNPFTRPWRGDTTWEGLLAQLEKLFASVARRAPWLRYRGTTEAAQALRAHLATEWRVAHEGETCRIAGLEGGHLRLRINHGRWRGIARLEGARCLHEARRGDHSLYLLKLTAPEARVILAPVRRLGAMLRRQSGRGRSALTGADIR
ncbi:MAG: DUF2194 domain-containing protein [Roseovarius sp.]